MPPDLKGLTGFARPRSTVASRAAMVACLLLSATASAQTLTAGTPNARDTEQMRIASTAGDDDRPSYRLSLRPSLGLGAGSRGFGGRFGGTVDYWPGDTIGLGLQAATFGQAEILGEQANATTVALAGHVRSAPRGSYLFLALSAGYARVTRSEDDGCVELFGTCPEPDVIRYDGYTVGTAVGFLAHPGRSWFEIGPVVQLDVMADPSGRVPADFLVTLNLTLGYALLQ
jgi:hypothetical protein